MDTIMPDIVAVLTIDNNLCITLPPVTNGQVGWYFDSPHNPIIIGDGWIARKWFPELITYNDARPFAGHCT